MQVGSRDETGIDGDRLEIESRQGSPGRQVDRIAATPPANVGAGGMQVVVVAYRDGGRKADAQGISRRRLEDIVDQLVIAT